MAVQLFTRLSRLCRPLNSQQQSIQCFSTLSSPTRSFRSIKSAIKSESDPVKIAELFSSPAPVATFQRHRPLLHLAVRKLSRFKRPELIEQVLNTIISNSTDTQLDSETFWSHMIVLYGEAGMVNNAHQVFDRMLHRKTCTFSEESLCAVLTVYLDNKICDERLHKVFSSVQEKLGVCADVKAYNLMLKAYCEANDIGLARKLLDKMENEANIVPNIDSYNVLLGAYWAKGGTSGFDWVLNEILDKGLEGNMITYNYRISRLCKSKDVVTAKNLLNLLDEMVTKGVKRNAATYNTIILWFCKVRDLEGAKEILERMVADGDVSQLSTGYVTLMQGMVEEGKFDSALSTCKEMLKRNWIPPFEAMKDLIIGLVQMSKVDEAKEVHEDMKKKLRGPAADSWKKIELMLPVALRECGTESLVAS